MVELKGIISQLEQQRAQIDAALKVLHTLSANSATQGARVAAVPFRQPHDVALPLHNENAGRGGRGVRSDGPPLVQRSSD